MKVYIFFFLLDHIYLLNNFLKIVLLIVKLLEFLQYLLRFKIYFSLYFQKILTVRQQHTAVFDIKTLHILYYFQIYSYSPPGPSF